MCRIWHLTRAGLGTKFVPGNSFLEIRSWKCSPGLAHHRTNDWGGGGGGGAIVTHPGPTADGGGGARAIVTHPGPTADGMPDGQSSRGCSWPLWAGACLYPIRAQGMLVQEPDWKYNWSTRLCPGALGILRRPEGPTGPTGHYQHQLVSHPRMDQTSPA